MCSSLPYSLFLRSLLEYSLECASHSDRLFCRPCKRLRVFVGLTSLINASKPVKVCHIFHADIVKLCQVYSANVSIYTSKFY